MRRVQQRRGRGFTLIELAITMAISVIVILALSVVMADNQRGWNRMYTRIYAEAVEDGYVARRTFERIVRQSSSASVTLDPGGQWVETQYFANPGDTALSRYARFHVDSQELKVEHGNLSPKTATDVQAICSGVTSCAFTLSGEAVQMILALDDGEVQKTILAAALLNNQ